LSESRTTAPVIPPRGRRRWFAKLEAHLTGLPFSCLLKNRLAEAAAVASHLVKVDPQTAGWWISLAYAVRRTESVEKAEAILLRARKMHPQVAMIAFNLACYASVTVRMEEAKARLRQAIALDKEVRKLAIEDEDLKPLWNWIAGLE
jgi:Flp pilus assembly protein TadD